MKKPNKNLSRFGTLAFVSLLLPFSPGAQAQQPTGSSQAGPSQTTLPNPPIPIRFTLPQAGYVTLVIEDAAGKRVRNLIAETPLQAGENTVYWDGLDDIGRDPQVGRSSAYNIPGKMVLPGSYVVRGLVRPAIEARYEMSVYSHGSPPWRTEDKGSEWLTNHTPPAAILWVPASEAPARAGKAAPNGQVLVGSWVAEGGSGLAWIDTSGRKVWGQHWVGGVWTGVTELTRDEGKNPVPGVYAYSASAWDDELRLSVLQKQSGVAPRDTRFGSGEDQPLLTPKWKFPVGTADLTDKGFGAERGIAGLAVHNGLLVASLPVLNQLLFVDAHARKVLGTTLLADPRGLAFDKQGRLLVLSGARLLRFVLGNNPTQLTTPEVLVASGLEDPQRVTLDGQGKIYISDWGKAHQVKLFAPDGRLVRAIGQAGAPRPGPYQPRHMNHPLGVTVDGQGRLWVAENDFAPKRISVWSQNGKLLDAYYGPSQYGGGGEIDPRDKTRFLYGGEGGALEFQLDWQRGTDRLLNVLSRKEYNPANLPQGAIGATQPQTALYHNNRRYLTNVYNNNPTGGIPFGVLYAVENGIAMPRAALGNAGAWAHLAWTLPGYNKYFYVRWSGQIMPRHSQTYKFTTLSDDGVRLWIGDQKVIDRWEEKGRSEDSGSITLEAGKRYDITMEFYQNQGGALAQLFWEGPNQPREIVPSSQLFPTKDAAQSGGLKAFYAAGTVYGDLRGATHTHIRIDPTINFDWNSAGPDALQTPGAETFRTRFPQNLKRNDNALFAWSDTNGDGGVQAEEVSFLNAGDALGGVTIMPDLSFVVARVGDKALRFAPTALDRRGVPRYDLNRGEVLVDKAQSPVSSGGGQALVASNGWSVHTNAPQPFSAHGVGGAKNGTALWSYPSLWHGLHASHHAPLPDRPGQLLGTTRLLGGFVMPKGGEAGPLWAINGNKGNVYLFTADGLFVATLFRDSRKATFNAPREERNMVMNDLSLQEENFWPMMSQTAEGNIYLIGGNSSIMRLDGLDKIRRLSAMPLRVSQAQLQEAQSYFVQQEALRQASLKPEQSTLFVALKPNAPVVDGKLDEWDAKGFVPIDPKASAAVAVAGERLYAAWKTDETGLLRNQPESLANLFKSGGALDLMIGNLEGGQRLLVTKVGAPSGPDKTTAVLYRPRDPNAQGEPIKFISNLGINKTVSMDRVQNVSDQVQLAQDGTNYELSVPLSLLNLQAQAGQNLKGDIGMLRGNGVQTLQRLYWHNKATGLVSDLATEAELTPQLWGRWEFRNQ